jgi:transcriptional regulator with XRE-family HTH domain
MQTEGQDKLSRWVDAEKDRGKTIADCAARLGIHRTTLWRWLKGTGAPDRGQALEYARTIKIPVGAWGREAT